MKKITLLVLLAFISLQFTAQESEETKEGFTAEVLGGIGRNLIKGESSDGYDYFENDIVGRFGIS